MPAWTGGPDREADGGGGELVRLFSSQLAWSFRVAEGEHVKWGLRMSAGLPGSDRVSEAPAARIPESPPFGAGAEVELSAQLDGPAYGALYGSFGLTSVSEFLAISPDAACGEEQCSGLGGDDAFSTDRHLLTSTHIALIVGFDFDVAVLYAGLNGQTVPRASRDLTDPGISAFDGPSATWIGPVAFGGIEWAITPAWRFGLQGWSVPAFAGDFAQAVPGFGGWLAYEWSPPARAARISDAVPATRHLERDDVEMIVVEPADAWSIHTSSVAWEADHGDLVLAPLEASERVRALRRWVGRELACLSRDGRWLVGRVRRMIAGVVYLERDHAMTLAVSVHDLVGCRTRPEAPRFRQRDRP